MRLGISSYTFGWAVGVERSRPTGALTAADLIRRATALGVRVVQLCDNLPADTWEPSNIESIAAQARAAGISIEVGTRGIGEVHLRRFIWVARQLSSPILRVVIDTPDDRPEPAEIPQQLAKVIADLEGSRVTLAIENHDRLSTAALRQIIQAVNSPWIGICLDTANSLGSLEGLDAVLESLGQFVVNLHLKDVAAVRFPHLQGFTIEGRPAGQGMIDIPRLLEGLKELKRDPNAIIELWTPPEAEMQATIQKEEEWARQSVRKMRRWIED